MKEWDEYRIRIPNTSEYSPGDGTVLTTVHHVVHVPGARRILEDDRLRAGLIYDESRLNKSRTCVTWVSANTWGLGSIYGNVQFSFDWSELIKGRQFYWVEVMKSYSPHAYRLLVTDRDLSNSSRVTPYDPSKDEGPLRRQGGAWYWNGKATSEFMIEADINLSDCIDFNFISHNSNNCSLNGPSCADRNVPSYVTGGKVLAFLLGNDIHTIDHVLKVPPEHRPEGLLSNAVELGIAGIDSALGSKAKRFSGAIRSRDSRLAVVRGALALYGADQKQAARELVGLLKSRDVFEKAIVEIVNEHFGISGWILPD